jgi:CheY-like chemotaxis protein
MVSEIRPEAGANPQHDPRFNVLIADDDRGTRETLSELLRAKGFGTIQAKDGGEAVEIVQVNMVHLVLFDMHMPRLTGLEALNVLRQTLDRVLPAVLMTADATKELMRQAFLAQVHSVIPKPVNKNVVLHTLARALEKVYGTLVQAVQPPRLPAPPGKDAGNPTTTEETAT